MELLVEPELRHAELREVVVHRLARRHPLVEDEAALARARDRHVERLELLAQQDVPRRVEGHAAPPVLAATGFVLGRAGRRPLRLAVDRQRAAQLRACRACTETPADDTGAGVACRALSCPLYFASARLARQAAERTAMHDEMERVFSALRLGNAPS